MLKKKRVTEEEFTKIQKQRVQESYDFITDDYDYVPDCMVEVFTSVALDMAINYTQEHLEIIPEREQ
jgi:hypothetical protein